MKTKPIPDNYIDLDTVRLWEQNYNEGNVGLIAIMIRRYGFNRAPSIWRDNEVRAGNHTVMALRELQKNGDAAPEHVIEQDGKWYIPYIDVSHLNETEALAYAIADNKAAKEASEDEAMLAKYLKAIKNDDETLFEATGFDEDDIRKLFAKAHVPMFPEGGLTDDDESSDDVDFNPPESAVRMVHLFFDKDNIDDFNAKIDELMKAWDIDNVTDAVLKAVQDAVINLT